MSALTDMTPRQVACGVLGLLEPRPRMHDQREWFWARDGGWYDLEAVKRLEADGSVLMDMTAAACLVAGMSLRYTNGLLQIRLPDGSVPSTRRDYRFVDAYAIELLAIPDDQRHLACAITDNLEALEFLRHLANPDDPTLEENTR